MNDFVIKLENVDLKELYGPKNLFMDYIISKYPTLTISSRGSVIKISGEESDTKDFEKKIHRLITYMNKFGHLSNEVIDQVFDAVSIKDIKNLPDKEKDVIIYGNNGVAIKSRTKNQQLLIDKAAENDLIFAIGPAGTGKTYTAIALAVRALRNREVKKIILTRPAVEAGERLGFLPGDMKDKLDPYLQPLYDALHDMVPVKKLEEFIETSVVQIVPLAYMRGRTLDNAFVILDEAQNTTLPQIKMFLTRMGKNAKFIVTGDVTQIDLPRKSDSGLYKSVKMLSEIPGISVIEMKNADIVRHRLVKDIVKAFEDNNIE